MWLYNNILRKRGTFTEFLWKRLKQIPSNDNAEVVSFKSRLAAKLVVPFFNNKVIKSDSLSNTIYRTYLYWNSMYSNSSLRPCTKNCFVDIKTMILTLRMKRGVFIFDPPVVVLAENDKEGWLV